MCHSDGWKSAAVHRLSGPPVRRPFLSRRVEDNFFTLFMVMFVVTALGGFLAGIVGFILAVPFTVISPIGHDSREVILVLRPSRSRRTIDEEGERSSHHPPSHLVKQHEPGGEPPPHALRQRGCERGESNPHALSGTGS
jgi:hypothetical protein